MERLSFSAVILSCTWNEWQLRCQNRHIKYEPQKTALEKFCKPVIYFPEVHTFFSSVAYILRNWKRVSACNHAIWKIAYPLR